MKLLNITYFLSIVYTVVHAHSDHSIYKHSVSVDALPGTSSSVRMQVHDSMEVLAYENPDMKQRFFTSMERQSRDVLFLIWSDYTPLSNDEAIPVNLNKQAYSRDGSNYTLPNDFFATKQKGGIRRIYLKCDKVGKQEFRVQTAYHKSAHDNFDFSEFDRYDPMGVTTYTIFVTCDPSEDL